MTGGDALASGTRLEEFEIERELGAGGFGVTYLAHDRSLDRRVAIKEYLPRDWGARGPDGSVGPRLASDAEDYRWGLERFLKEARALARLRHVHILQVYQVFEARGTAYMVTEYVEGRSLAAALRAEGPWSETRVLALLDALTSGLAVVHSKGLVHRDVKPANVMLRGDESPVLIDFGAVRRAAGGGSGSLLPVLTPGYAPIEQYTEKGVLGPWTDVYALGAVAYEALSGRVPEKAPGRVAEDNSLRPVAEAAPQAVSARLSSAVMSALALRREDRPQSLTDWRALLGLPAAGDAGARAAAPAAPSEPAGSEAPPETGPATASRWRLAGAAALAAVVLAVAGLAWWVGGAGLPETAGTIARAPVEENAVEAAIGEGGGSGGPEVSEVGVSGQADAAATVPEVGTGGGSDSPPEADETGSGPDGPTRPGAVFSDCDACPEMVVIPGGDFMMGSPASEQGRFDNEGPQHRVAVSSFALGRYEVTREEYRVFVETTGHPSSGCWILGEDGMTNDDDASWREPGFAQGSGHPAVCVNWNDAQAYVRWLSRETGESYRLPSEAEWEYAARGGTSTSRYWGDSSSSQCGHANGADAAAKRVYSGFAVAACNDGAVHTAPAGSYSANVFGLFDVLGNVFEWTADCWHENYRGAPTDGSPWHGGDCRRRVLRGGSWYADPRDLRSAARDRTPTENRISFAGFRVARTLD